MEKYKKLLVAENIKPTFQRIKILQYLDHHHNHPTVDMIYEGLYDAVPTLSKTTVYNTLDLFRKSGLVNALYITETELRYELRHQIHHHFYCRKCGRIIDVDVGCEYQDLMTINGHKIEEIHGSFRGICNDCLKK